MNSTTSGETCESHADATILLTRDEIANRQMPASAAFMDDQTIFSTPVELLVIGCDPVVADGYANALRNQGQATHVQVAASVDALRQLLTPDAEYLCIVNVDSLGDEAGDAITLIRKAMPSAGILLVGDAPHELVDLALELDLQDCIATDNEQQVALAVRREHNTHLLRWQVQDLQSKLEEAEQRSNQLVHSSRDAIAYIHDGMYLATNQAYLDIFGYDAFDEIDGLPIMDMIDSESRTAFKAAVRKAGEIGEYAAEFNCVTSAGEPFFARMEFSPASIDGEACVQVMIRDQSHSLALQQRIDELTNKDALTGLLNRQAFIDQLDAVLTRPDDAQDNLALLDISIANHPDIRKACGISCSDQLLRELASLIRSPAEGLLAAARFGEHDFMLLCTSIDEARPLAERYLDTVRAHRFTSVEDAGGTRPAVAIGIASAGIELTAHEVLNRACRAAESAHADGDSGILVVQDPSAAAAAGLAESEAATVALIDRALTNDGFRLKYQPIVSLQGDSRENYSVYLRLLDGDEEVGPDAFLAAAERSERMKDIDRWVIRSAIRELSNHRRSGKKVVFFINLGRASIADDSMLLWICDCLREFRTKGSWLVFQFRSVDLREVVEPARNLIAGLRRINCRIALSGYMRGDDSILKRLDLDFVRLSPDFLRELARSPVQQKNLESANEGLQQAGYRTIVTNIEDAGSLAILWNMGVDYIQGYFLQKPTGTISYDEQADQELPLQVTTA
jgi:multidomain signaling protein FimX